MELIGVNAATHLTLFSRRYSCTRHFLLSFYSYRTARNFSEPRSVERRLSFAVEVTTASGNWKHPLLLKIILVPVSNGCYVLEIADT